MEKPPLNACAVVIEGTAHNGKPCRLVDNTGTIARQELESLLQSLIEQQAFGLSGLSAMGGNTIKLGEPDFTHVQMGDDMYRLIVWPYEARLDVF